MNKEKFDVSFDTLYHDYHCLAKYLAKRYKTNPALSDADSEAMLILVQCAKMYKKERGIPFATYYAYVAKYRLARWATRRLKRYPFFAGLVSAELNMADIAISDIETADVIAERTELLSKLKTRAKNFLTKKEYKVVQLLMEGLSQTKISKRLRISRQAVHILKESAYQKIRLYLE
jgi:RNA polymerase sigma factor (sigma-70 family)